MFIISGGAEETINFYLNPITRMKIKNKVECFNNKKYEENDDGIL